MPAAGLLFFGAAALFAQTSTDTTSASQAEQDREAARRAAGASVGAAGTGAAGTGTSGTGAGMAERPQADAADGMERNRSRNMSGARPGDAPSQQPGGAAVTNLPPATTDMGPAVGGASGSGPGASLGGLPSDGVTSASGGRAPNDATSPARDSRTTARMIGETSFVYRDRAMTLAERELSEGSSLSSSILRGSETLSGAARTRVNDSVTKANEARTELAKAISRARSANSSRWESSREDVVERYEAYSKALEEARAAATEGGVKLEDAAGTSAMMPTPR